MNARHQSKWLWRFMLLIAGLNILFSLLGIIHRIFQESDGSIIGSTNAIISIVYSILAVLILARYPRHKVGWLFMTVGFFLGFQELESLLRFAAQSELANGYLDWISHTFWVPGLLINFTLIWQFFPNGHLPSRRWWPVPAFSIVGILGIMASFGLIPWPALGISSTYNPLAIPGSESFFNNFLYGAVFFYSLGVLGTLVLVMVRFRGSTGVERYQMKWLVYIVVIGISLMLISRAVIGWLIARDETFLLVSNPIGDVFFQYLPILFGLVTGMAILRYRLFDIDIIIRRTLQYGLLTGLLLAIYFGLVVGFQFLFAAFGEPQSEIFIVISTLIVAALFNPLRRRIQDFIDRRFYRQKYEAGKVLAQFAATARDEVDLDQLSVEVLAVIVETLQPEHVSISIFSDRPEKEKTR